MICYALALKDIVYHGYTFGYALVGYRFPKGLASRRAYGLSSYGDLSEHGDKPEHECIVDYYGRTTLSTSLLLRG